MDLAILGAFSSAFGKVEIVAISDPFIDLKHMVYMFQYDSTHKCHSIVKAQNWNLVIKRSQIIIESTGVFTTMEKAGTYLKDGTNRIIIFPFCYTPCL